MGRKQNQNGLSRRAVLAGATLAAIDPLLRSRAFAQSASQGAGFGTATAPVKLRMMANEAYARSWQTSMVPAFNKAFPHIELTIDGVPYNEQLAKLLLEVTSATPTYDILIIDDPWIPQVAQTGALLDLKKDVDQWTSPEFDWADFNSAPLAASEWKGVQYGVPVRSNMLLMFYNRTHYEKAGVPVPTPELKWTEFMAQAPKLVQSLSGGGKADAWAIGTYFTRDSLTPTIWQAVLNSNGGALLDDQNKPAFNNDVGIKALQTHIDLLKYAPPGALSHGFNESLQAFRQGQVASMFQWGSVYKGTAVDAATTTLKTEQVGIQVMPAGSKFPSTHRGIWSGTLARKSKNQQAAWAMLQWLTSKEGEKWHSNNLGVFPARKSTLAHDPESTWLVPVFKTLQQSYDVAAQGKMWRPRHPKSDAVQQILADVTGLAVSGQTTSEAAIADAARRIERTLRSS
jgi:multiple sugar transport system substrate-binding protein